MQVGVMIVRPEGLHLPNGHFLVDGSVMPAHLVGVISHSVTSLPVPRTFIRTFVGEVHRLMSCMVSSLLGVRASPIPFSAVDHWSVPVPQLGAHEREWGSALFLSPQGWRVASCCFFPIYSLLRTFSTLGIPKIHLVVTFVCISWRPSKKLCIWRSCFVLWKPICRKFCCACAGLHQPWVLESCGGDGIHICAGILWVQTSISPGLCGAFPSLKMLSQCFRKKRYCTHCETILWA